MTALLAASVSSFSRCNSGCSDMSVVPSPPELARDELLMEVKHAGCQIPWAAPDLQQEADSLMHYQRGRPCCEVDPVMGSLRQDVLHAMGVVPSERIAIKLMNTLERSGIVSRNPRRVMSLQGLDELLDRFVVRRDWCCNASQLTDEQKEGVRRVLTSFDTLAQRRTQLRESQRTREHQLHALLDKQAALLPPEAQVSQCTQHLLANKDVQRMRQAYLAVCRELHAYPSQMSDACQ